MSEMNGNHGPDVFSGKSGVAPLIELNERHAVIENMGGKCMVMSWEPSDINPAYQVPVFQTFRTICDRYAHRYIKVKKKKRSETVEENTAIGAYWLKWDKRTTYRGIELAPGEPRVTASGRLNLWKGFACEAVPGDWSLMKRHIREVLAAGDDASAVYILKFIAWAAQHPDKPAEASLVLRGGKGAGKGVFGNAFISLFGAHGLHIYNPKHLVGNFNAHLRLCVALLADEAFWAGDKAGESTLKGLITEPTLFIEQKGIDAMACRNLLHVIMLANANWVVPASHDERRYAVFNVSDCRTGDQAWFDALVKQMDNGGREAMLYDLLNIDLGTWHPRNIPHTEALREQKIESMPPLWEWWESTLQDGRLPGIIEQDTLQSSAEALLSNARAWSNKLKDVTSTALGRFLTKLGAYRVHKYYGNEYKFDELDACRGTFEKRWGEWKWYENTTKWKQKVHKASTPHAPISP